MLFVFLGNPGINYKLNRHNFGFMFADYLETKIGLLNWSNKFKGEWTKADINGKSHFFLKPLTYMNKSGESVIAMTNFFKIGVQELVVIHDDIETDFEKVAIKKGGGLAGHNGLRSISKVLGTNDYLRLKLGTGRPSKGDVSSFVLSNFTDDEQIVLPLIFENAFNFLVSEKILSI
jgi:peptidyl-tRNA hydrolase, PTH1 family